MSKQSDDENPFMVFLRGYWQLPMEPPVLMISFMRGAILSVIVSMFIRRTGFAELLIWAVIIGLFWMAIDHFTWKRISKEKGE